MSQNFVFEQFGELPEPLKATGDQILSFVGAHLNAQTHEFDWKTFKDDIDYYDEDDMIFDKYKTLNLDQQLTKVCEVSPKIASFLKDVLPIQKTIEELQEIVNGAFLNLKDKKEQGYADFVLEKPKPEDPSAQGSSSSGGGLLSKVWPGSDKPKPKPVNSSYTYRLVFQAQSARVATDFYSLVTTVKVTADIEREEDWWKLEPSTEKNFGIDITAMELVVTQGFKTPVVQGK